ncbi:MAG TPA: hypothetical protein VH372_26195 [Actinospica sp.]|nr:hypothetical protein [Actinospica sp.]
MAGTAGCAPLEAAGNASDATPAAGAESHSASSAAGANSGCTTALGDVARYGPSTVMLLAHGREAVAKAAVRLLVDGLDGAANAADTPQTKQAIQALATAYVDYFDLTTDAVSIPLSALLKDTTDLEFACHD